MKLRHALSVTALLTGSGLAVAQEAPVDPVAAAPVRTAAVVQPSRPTTLVDQLKARQVQHGTHAVTADGTPVMFGDCGQCNLFDGGAVAPDYRVFFRGEYLLWRISGSLMDSGTNTFPAIRNIMPWTAGVQNVVTRDGVPQDPLLDPLGQVGANIGLAQLNPRLFSGTNLEVKDRNGARLTAGAWLSDEIGVELSFFQLETRNASFVALASANPVTYSTGLTNFAVTSNPEPPPADFVNATPQTGAAAFNAQIDGVTWNRLWGMELNVRKRGYAVGTTQFDALFGFRYLNYDEVLFLEQALAVGGSAAGPGATVLGGGTALTSDMAARNRFYGFQVGGQFDTQIWDFTVGGRAKISIGGMNQDYAFAENVVGIANQPGIGGVAVDFNEVYPARAVRETRTDRKSRNSASGSATTSPASAASRSATTCSSSIASCGRTATR